jgi:hypothetical protein
MASTALECTSSDILAQGPAIDVESRHFDAKSMGQSFAAKVALENRRNTFGALLLARIHKRPRFVSRLLHWPTRAIST